MSDHPFAEALAPHYNDAATYCRALCARWSPSQADDVLPQALLKAFEHYDDLEDPTRFKRWLFQIITRTFYSAVRRAFWRRFVPLSKVPDLDQRPAVYRRPERFDDRQVLLMALASLSAKQRTALLLYELGGFSVKEITAIQGDGSPSAVKSRLSRARKRLQRAIARAEQGLAPPVPPQDASSQSEDLDHETLNMVALAERLLS